MTAIEAAALTRRHSSGTAVDGAALRTPVASSAPARTEQFERATTVRMLATLRRPIRGPWPGSEPCR